MMEMIVFPIIKALFFEDGTEEHKLVGTAFFLDGNRRFITAKHNFEGRESAVDPEGASRFAVYCIHSVSLSRKMVVRNVDLDTVIAHQTTDISTGLVSLEQFGRPNPDVLPEELLRTAYFDKVSVDPVAVGTPIYTIAYPLTTLSSAPRTVNISLQSDAFEGRITKHYPEKRDNSGITWPCYETDMEIKSGASGGPVLLSGSGGVVFAVNCRSIQPHVVSYVSSFAPLVAR
jgi:hypothetical protein